MNLTITPNFQIFNNQQPKNSHNNIVMPSKLSVLKADTVSFGSVHSKAESVFGKAVENSYLSQMGKFIDSAKDFHRALKRACAKLADDGFVYDDAYNSKHPIKSKNSYIDKFERQGYVQDTVRGTVYWLDQQNIPAFKKFIDTCWKQKYWRDGRFWVSKDNHIGLDYPKSVIALIKGGHVDIIKDFFGNAKNNFAYLGQEVIFSLYRYGALELIQYVWSTTSDLWRNGAAFVRRKDISLYKAYRKHVGRLYDRDEFQEVVQYGTVEMLSVFLNSVPRDDNNDWTMMYFLIENGSVDMIKTFIQNRGMSDQWRNMLTYAEREEVRSIVGAA